MTALTRLIKIERRARPIVLGDRAAAAIAGGLVTQVNEAAAAAQAALTEITILIDGLGSTNLQYYGSAPEVGDWTAGDVVFNRDPFSPGLTIEPNFWVNNLGGDAWTAKYALNDIVAGKLIGRASGAGYGGPQEIGLGSGLQWDGGGFNIQVDTASIIAAITGDAPALLNTLGELSDALGDDPNFATTVTAAISAKRDKNPVIQAVASSATVTPAFGEDLVKVTAQAAGLNLANWSGTAIPGWGLVIRIKDDGTARAITYGTKYRAMATALPTTTVSGKTLYLSFIYNSDDDKFDNVGQVQQA